MPFSSVPRGSVDQRRPGQFFPGKRHLLPSFVVVKGARVMKLGRPFEDWKIELLRRLRYDRQFGNGYGGIVPVDLQANVLIEQSWDPIGPLSRQRSRVRVSSSRPFFLKHLRWFSRNHRRPKRALFRALFCVPFRPVLFLPCRFPHAATSPDDDCDVHCSIRFPAKTPRTRPLPELRAWLA
jgi:hypothetical protein